MAASRSSSRRKTPTPASDEAQVAAVSATKNGGDKLSADDKLSGDEGKTASGKNYGDGDFDEIFALWRQNGDPELRDQLILMHRNLVVYLARRFADRGEVYEDIVQQGLIGLINALDNFRSQVGACVSRLLPRRQLSVKSGVIFATKPGACACRAVCRN